MTLDIYEETSEGVYTAISVDGAFTNPFTTVHHSRSGDTIIHELFVRADNSNSYSAIKVKADTTDGANDVGSGSSPGSSGWGVKLWSSTSSREPTEEDWRKVNYGESCYVSNLASSSTYVPFWVRIESPPLVQVRAQNKENIALYLEYIEEV